MQLLAIGLFLEFPKLVERYFNGLLQLRNIPDQTTQKGSKGTVSL